jgi:hypothetical protein
MKAALIDASSAILLFKADLLDPMTEAFELRVVPAVFQEITVAGRQGAAEFEAARTTGRLKQVAPPLPGPATVPASLGAGERETLAAFASGAAGFVIMDDRKGALHCRGHHIPYINALLCPNLLRASGYLDDTACTAAFGALLRLGRYSPWVVDFARRCAPRDLGCFMPDQVEKYPGTVV